jgi:hypothetical protein
MQDAPEQRRARERMVFASFAAVTNFPVVAGSIASAEPPEPDIVCKIKGEGKAAFELVEIIDKGYAHEVAKEAKTRVELNESFRRSKGPARSKLDELYSDALIFVQFKDYPSFQTRRGVIPAIFQFLATLPAGFFGEVGRKTFLLENSIKDSLDWLHISRIKGLSGPVFDCDASGAIGDPTVEAITEKCGKAYQTTYPKYLLAYLDSHPRFPKEIWLTPLADFLKSNSGNCQFTKVWVYDYPNNVLLYEFPLG